MKENVSAYTTQVVRDSEENSFKISKRIVQLANVLNT